MDGKSQLKRKIGLYVLLHIINCGYKLIIIFRFYIVFVFFFLLKQNIFHNNRCKIIVVIISCPKDFRTINLNISKLPFDVEIIICNKKSNAYDAREGGLILDYIINNYNRKKYKTAIFIHDHEKSFHYPYSITERIKKISHEDYIYKIDFIGVNCRYIQFNVGNKYEYIFHEVESIDKYYLSEIGIDHVNISEVHENRYIFPCCASFIINTKLFHIHSKLYYKTLRNALRIFTLYGFNNFHLRNISKKFLKLNYRNYVAGAYMEFTWSTMFGQKNVSLPPDCFQPYNF